MEYRTLGRTGLQVSPLCLGTWLWTERNTAQEGLAVIDQAIDDGVNFIDTSNVYNRGEAERVVGEGIKGRRDEVVLATKVFWPMDDDDPNATGLSRKHVVGECERSLKRLGTDYIDIYYLHRPDPKMPIEITLRALDDLISQGKVRYIASSCFTAAELVESLWKSEVGRWDAIVVEQPQYSLIRREPESDVVPYCAKYGVSLVPFSPLAGGLLTGKYRKNQPPPEGARLTEWGQHEKGWWGEAMDVVEKLLPHVEIKGCTLSQFALAWVYSQPTVVSAIMGPRNAAQLTDNLGALEVEITAEDNALVNELVSPGTQI